MKARTLPLVSAVIAGGFDEQKTNTIKDVCTRFGARLTAVQDTDGGSRIKTLLTGRHEGNEPLIKEEFLIMNLGASASAFIDALKDKGVIVPLKAVVTLTSQEWTVNQLVTELKEEHRIFSEGRAHNG